MAATPGHWKLEATNFVRGAVLAVGTALVSFFQQFIFPANGAPNFDFSTINWKVVAGTALAAFISYIASKLGTNKQGVTFGIAATQPNADKPKGKK